MFHSDGSTQSFVTELSPNRFKELWGDDPEPLVPASPKSLEELGFPLAAAEFFIKAGLPRSVAPFLGFDLDASNLVPVSGRWGLGPEFDDHILVGSNGSGDPICLVRPTGRIVYLNHDDGFDETLINTSISRFAECAVVFRDLAAATMAANGEDAFLDNDIPPPLLAQAKTRLLHIDPDAFAPGTFWFREFEELAAGPC